MYIGLHVKYRYSCQILMQLEFLSTDFGKYSNIKIKKKKPVVWEPSRSKQEAGETDEQTWRS